jgi:hypothetical protein
MSAAVENSSGSLHTVIVLLNDGWESPRATSALRLQRTTASRIKICKRKAAESWKWSGPFLYSKNCFLLFLAFKGSAKTLKYVGGPLV